MKKRNYGYKMKAIYYVLGGFFVLFNGCTNVERQATPSSTRIVRTYDIKPVIKKRTPKKMQKKLKKIRTPIKGKNLSRQKHTLVRDVDTMLRDTRNYVHEIARFEKMHPVKKVKSKRKMIENDTNVSSLPIVPTSTEQEALTEVKDSNDSKLKYY